jgi:hypothetical protein
MSTLYDVLQVPRDADDGRIKAAWRSRVKSAHPDVGGSAEAFARLDEAYRTLTDPELRAAYDRKLDRAAAPEAEDLEDSFTVVEDETLDGVDVTESPAWAPRTDPVGPMPPPPWAPAPRSRRRLPVRRGRVLAGLFGAGFVAAVALLARAVQLHIGQMPQPAPSFIVTPELYDASMLLFGSVELAAALAAASVALHAAVAVCWLRRRQLPRALAAVTVATGLGCVAWVAVPLVLVAVSFVVWAAVVLIGLWLLGTVLTSSADRPAASRR